MAIPSALRYELTKYHKRSKLTLNRSEHGVPYATYRRSRRYVSGMPRTPRQNSYHNNFYNSGTPRSYHPSLNAPAVRVDEYETEMDWESHNIRHSSDPKLFRPFPDIPKIDRPVNHEESEKMSKFFLDAMDAEYMPSQGRSEVLGEYNEPVVEMRFDISDQTPEEIARKFTDLVDAHGQLLAVLPEGHPDVVSLRSALSDIINDPQTMSKLESLAGESRPSKLGVGDPYENDPYEEAQQAFGQQMQLIEQQLDRPSLAPVEMQEFHMPDDTLPQEHFIQEQTLEQIIEADPFEATAPEFMEQDVMPHEMVADMGMPGSMPEPIGYDADMAADEINHAIDQVTEKQMIHEPEPDPFQQQYDPFMAPEYMVDPQMQYMQNYMMPGPVPFGPGIGPAMPGSMPGM